jgi:signal transduction histidine kinase/CheY-like chemotaxis protein
LTADSVDVFPVECPGRFIALESPLLGRECAAMVRRREAVGSDQAPTPETPNAPPRGGLLLATVIESFPWAVLAEDVDRRILAVNAAFSRLFLAGADSHALLGLDSRAVWQRSGLAEDDALSLSPESHVQQQVPVRGERIHLSDGRLIERDYVPLRADSEAAAGHLWLYSDMTSERRAEEYQHTTRKMEAVGRLAGGIAHDLNNALTAILGHASLLGMELDDRPDLAESVSEIQIASERAAALARNLLAFSRKQILQPRRVDPAEVVRRVEELLGRILNEGVELTVDLPRQTSTVRVDPIKLEHALLHLAMNARDAMPSGGALSIGLEYRSISADEVRSYPFPISAGRYAILSVADTGTGISDEIRGKVFEPFFSTKPRHQGTGLGLSTVYGFVKQSEGFVWVESEEGEGAVVHIALPVSDDGAERAEAATPPPSEQRGERPATILVAEDEPAVLAVIRRGLEERGYHVLAARDGVEALEILDRAEQQIDLLVTDVIMPRMGGAELAQRAHELCPRMPVIFTSGYSGDVHRYLQLAPDQFQLLEKPFMSADILRVVEDMLAG